MIILLIIYEHLLPDFLPRPVEECPSLTGLGYNDFTVNEIFPMQNAETILKMRHFIAFSSFHADKN